MARSQKFISPSERVAEFLRLHFSHDSNPLLVAVSGGPDSVCLLHILHNLSKKTGLSLCAAHLDHALRPDSTNDAQYVFDLCHKLDIPIIIERADVKAFQKKNKLSLEEAAREVRYDFLARAARSAGTNTIALGHTQNDQAETILLHIIRGSGTRGLRGLQPVSQRKVANKRLTLLRPLLHITRSETESYCSRNRLEPHIDPTNMDTSLLRNRVRLQLLPDLKKYNPGIIEALLRNAAVGAADVEFIDKNAAAIYKRIVRRQANGLQISREGILKLHPSLQRAILRKAIENVTGTLKDIEAGHIEDMLDLLVKPTGKRIQLPYGLTLRSDYDVIYLEHRQNNMPTSMGGEYLLPGAGQTGIPGWRVSISIAKKKTVERENPFIANLDASRVTGKITVRGRHPGDRFHPLGLQQSKKVGQFMIDSHIPQTMRANVPVVCIDGKVAWVVGHRIDDNFKVTAGTKKVLRICFERS